MPYMLGRHRIKDYAQWKSVFEDHADARKAMGCKGGLILRNADDPSEIIVFLEWESLEKAREFPKTHDVADAKARGGVIDEPDGWFLELVERAPA